MADHKSAESEDDEDEGIPPPPPPLLLPLTEPEMIVLLMNTSSRKRLMMIAVTRIEISEAHVNWITKLKAALCDCPARGWGLVSASVMKDTWEGSPSAPSSWKGSRAARGNVRCRWAWRNLSAIILSECEPLIDSEFSIGRREVFDKKSICVSTSIWILTSLREVREHFVECWFYPPTSHLTGEAFSNHRIIHFRFFMLL